MVCPLCNRRKAKRACPALGKPICTVCCGTKRQVEITCPHTCVYLASSRTHPPAVVQRQLELDRAMLLPLLQGFSDRQARAFLMLAAMVVRHKSEALQTLLDADIAQATEALAATLETADRGIVYEHQPASLPAARLTTELKAAVAEMTQSGGSGLERDATIALRRLEAAARTSSQSDARSTRLRDLLHRMLAPSPLAASHEPDTPAPQTSPLIIP